MSICNGLIAWYGFPYISGGCKTSIQSYQGPKSNYVTFAIDKKMLTQNLDPNDKETLRKLEHELEMLMGHKIMAGPNVECMIDDDCHTKMEVCNREQTCEQAELPSDAVCAKGFDCGKGEMCINGRCRSYTGSCGSKKDCSSGRICGKDYLLQYNTCIKRISELNAFGFEIGRIFYNPICKLIIKDSASSRSISMEFPNQLHFSCEFIYEADAISNHLLRDEDLFIRNDDTETECQLLHLQFRTFQIDMVDLQVLNGHLLEIFDCQVEDSLITTSSPPRAIRRLPGRTTSA